MKNVHGQLVFKRRVRILANELASRLPYGASVLDIGCGSGDIALAIMAQRPDLKIQGVDVLLRPQAALEVTEYDGKKIPFRDADFDVAMLVDVLHHTDEPALVLTEASRVARTGILLKDHFSDGFAAKLILRFMDWFGNASHGVRLPYNYLTRGEWHEIWDRLDLEPNDLGEGLRIYPMPFDLIFGRALQFATLLRKLN